MSGGAKQTINIYSFIGLAIVVIAALFGGFLINLLNGIKRFKWPMSYCIKSTKPLFKFTIPSLIGNIILGCLGLDFLTFLNI